MFATIKKILDERFGREYMFELTTIFAQNATFADYTSQSDLDLDAIIDNLLEASLNKLKELIPSIKLVEYEEGKAAKSAVALKCFATNDEDDIVYGISVWIKTEKGWKTFEPLTNSWSITKSVPYSQFYVRYRDHNSGDFYVCNTFDKMEDFYFIY